MDCPAIDASGVDKIVRRFLPSELARLGQKNVVIGTVAEDFQLAAWHAIVQPDSALVCRRYRIGLSDNYADIGGRHLVEALIVAPVIVVLDEGRDLAFEVGVGFWRDRHDKPLVRFIGEG